MDTNFKKARTLVNKIIKNFKRNDLEWTIQTSASSVHPDKLAYCVQIEAPANGLAPLTFIKNSWKELIEALDQAEKNLDTKAIEKAFLASEIKRAEEKKKFFEEKLLSLENES